MTSRNSPITLLTQRCSLRSNNITSPSSHAGFPPVDRLIGVIDRIRSM
ncbi:MAG: hypothetical protein WAM21_20900 [Steroidobacteraceae bacterium]